MGGMDQQLFSNILDTMGSYNQTRNFAKYGIKTNNKGISNSVKQKLYRNLWN